MKRNSSDSSVFPPQGTPFTGDPSIGRISGQQFMSLFERYAVTPRIFGQKALFEVAVSPDPTPITGDIIVSLSGRSPEAVRTFSDGSVPDAILAPDGFIAREVKLTDLIFRRTDQPRGSDAILNPSE